ncbi:MAG: CHASE3 domain-containing protein [Opitutaceae bacterium]|nr:CHASE3 domain-containing protein [Cytophagales bacterium]
MRINVVRILLCFSIGLTLLCSSLIYFARQQKSEDLMWVLHTHEVIENTVTLLSSIQDAENGQRGYILTQNIEFLKPYSNAINQIDSQLKKVRHLTVDNKKQQLNLDRLDTEIAYRMRLIDTTLKLEGANRNKEAIEFIKRGNGRISMDSIRAILNRVLIQEDQLLIIRNENLKESAFFSSLISFSSLFFIGSMSVISLFVISKKQKINRNLIKDLSTYNLTLESQIKQRTIDLETINQKLVLLNEDKNQFLGMAAHDLKNPINTIKGLINILQITGETNLSDEQKEILDHVNNSTSKMSKLISDLLDINRIDQGMTDIQFEPENLLQIVEGVIYGFKEIAEQKEIGITLLNLLTNKTLSTDKNALVRILDNLVSNAIKFSSKGKDVHISLYNKNGLTYISVKDEGPGIKEEEKHLLFGKFKKLSNRPTEGESSTGLGLSIVKSLVEAMNGSIEYTSEVGKGTTFTLVFKS